MYSSIVINYFDHACLILDLGLFCACFFVKNSGVATAKLTERLLELDFGAGSVKQLETVKLRPLIQFQFDPFFSSSWCQPQGAYSSFEALGEKKDVSHSRFS